MAQPQTVNDTVLYNPRNLHADQNVALFLLDGSQLDIWGQVFINGNPLGSGGTFPIATQAEAEAGVNNSNAMTPLRTSQHLAANFLANFPNNSSTNAKLADMVTNRIKGRVTPSTGDPEDLTPSDVRSIIASDVANSTFFLNGTGVFSAVSATVPNGDKGDISVTSGVWTIDDGVVINSRLSNVSTNTIKGRRTATTGVVEDLSPANARLVLASDSGGSSASYFSADGTWSVPVGSGGGSSGGAAGHVTYTYSGTLTTPPTGGQIRFNSSSQTAATKLYANDSDFDNLDISIGLSRILVGDQIYVQEYTNSAKWVKYTVTGVADQGTYWEYTIVYLAGPANVSTGKVELQPISPGTVGVPAGGTTGQSLVKTSNTDYAVGWSTVSGGGSGVTIGDKGDILVSGVGADTWLFDDTVITTAARTVLNKSTTDLMLSTLNGVNKGGDVMTGTLTCRGLTTSEFGVSVPTTATSDFGPLSITGIVTASGQIKSNASAPSTANDLTRKDYVDGQISTRQPVNTNLSTIGGLTPTSNNFIVGTGTAWALSTPANVKTALAITESDVTNLVTDLAAKVNNVQGVSGIWTGTQAAYDAIGTKSSSTLYVIT